MIMTFKSIKVLFGIFALSALVLGSATQAEAETLKCKSELSDEKIREEQQFDYTYSVGVNLKEGMAICENGETAEVKSFNLWNVDYPTEVFLNGITVYTFKDYSRIITKANFHYIRDPKGESEWIWEGTGEIIKGVKGFKGIKGSVSFKGKMDRSDKKVIIDITLNYTLPPK
jgi:hypothetical protein